MPHFNYTRPRCARGRAWTWAIGAYCALLAISAPCAEESGPSALIRDGLGPSDPAVTATLPAYLEARSANFVDWLADGSLLIRTRFGVSEQIHRVRAPLAAREQLTFAADGVRSAVARPYAADALVYLERRHGGAASQLKLLRLSEPVPIALTDGEHRDGPALFAHDGKRIAFSSNLGDAAGREIDLLDLSGASASAPKRLVGDRGGRWRAYDWSIDDKRLLVGRELADAATGGDGAQSPTCEIYVVDVASGELTPVAIAADGTRRAEAHGHARAQAPSPEPVQARDARFATDGHGVVLLTRQSGAPRSAPGFAHLSYVDLSGQEWRDLSLNGSRDVERFDQSGDGRYLAYTLNDGGTSRLMLIDQQRKLDLAVGELPPGVISDLKFDSSGKHLALSLETPRAPRDVYVLEPDTHLLTRWTQSEVGALDPQSFVLPERIQFPTWDRVDGQPRTLPGLIYRQSSSAPSAVVILLGGVGAQSRPAFEPFLQFLVRELKLVVVVPNTRGAQDSAGNLDDASPTESFEAGGRDVGALLVWIGLQHGLDRNRVAVLGEGRGSLLALESLAEYGDRLRGGVVAFSPHLSSSMNVAAIRRPVLLVHGLQNPAAPAYELEQLRARLRVNGVEAQYLAAPQEAQAFERKSDRDAYLEAAADFLSTLLR